MPARSPVDLQHAEQLFQQGDLVGAGALFATYMEHRVPILSQQGALNDDDLWAGERLGDIKVLTGSPQAVDSWFRGLAGLMEKQEYVFGSDYFHLKRALICLERGHRRAALSAFDELSWDCKPRHDMNRDDHEAMLKRHNYDDVPSENQTYFAGLLFFVHGLYHSSGGFYNAALACFCMGEELLFGCGDPSARHLSARIDMKRAVIRLEMGHLDEVETYLDRQVPETEPGLLLERLQLEGRHAMISGNLGMGIRCYQELVNYCSTKGFDHGCSVAKINLAQIFTGLNLLGQAFELLREAWQEWGRNMDESESNHFLNAARTAHHRIGDLKSNFVGAVVLETWRGETRPVSNKPLTAFSPPQYASFLTSFQDYSVRFYDLLFRFGTEEALEAIREIKELFGHTDSDLIRMRIDCFVGLVAYYQMKEGGEAFPRQIDDLFETVTTFALDAGLYIDFLNANKYRLRLKEKGEQADLQELQERIQQKVIETLSPEERDFLYLSEQDNKGALVNRIVQEIQEKGDNRSNVLALIRELDDHRALKWYRFFLGLRRGQVMLSLTVLPTTIVAILIDRYRHRLMVLETSKPRIRELVRQWHRSAALSVKLARNIQTSRNRFLDNTRKADELAGQISQELALDDLLGPIPVGICRLIIVADDVLSGFPFSALRYQAGGEQKYLCERFAISYRFNHTPRRRRKVKQHHVLLGGMAGGSTHFAALPAVAKEINQLKDRFSSHGFSLEVVQDPEQSHAGREQILKELKQATLFHMACHGIFDAKKPHRSGFVLVDKQEETCTITIEDITKMDLANLCLVTLSHCWSATNFILPGRKVISLPRAFTHEAGAGSVLSCLWPVDDAAAVTFMDRFYQETRRRDLDQALQSVQIGFIRGEHDCSGISLNHPFFWAGFQLYGETGRL